MKTVCLIPARGGSQRIPRKNIRLFHGKPIIAYSIETAQASGLFDQVIVSTEDNEIAEIAKQYGAEIHHRHFAYAADYIGTQEVARHILSSLNEIDYACVVYATSPLMLPKDLIEGKQLLDERRSDFVMCVGGSPLRDAGQWYWGTAEAFRKSHLITPYTTLFPIPESRVCDINVEADWQRAEEMFLKLGGK